MKIQWATLPMLLLTVLAASMASCQTNSARPAPDSNPPTVENSQAGEWHTGGVDPYFHSDPRLPVNIGSQAGRGLPGGKDPSAKIGPSTQLSEAGDVAAKKGDWQTAGNKYQDAIDLWPDNTQALYGLAKCAQTNGDLDTAIGFYRTAIYSHDPKVYGTVPGDGYRTNDVERMMEFVLLLSQAHQEIEAQKVYKRAAHVLNYQDSQFNGGKPFLKVLLPEFSTGPGQLAYTPQHLQAMAHVTLSIESAGFDLAAAMQEIQKAVQLYPDSAVVNYYLGERRLLGDIGGAKAAYAKAAQLGDAQVAAAARDRLKHLP